ncbi:MAG: hypothetical protein P8L49_15810 [Opitutaceae bacterium]|nr:hypothetical protein [Opitutaceae bacterium]
METKSFDTIVIGCGTSAYFCISPLNKAGQKVGDRINIHRRFLKAKSAVQVRTDADVKRIPCKLAHVIDMVDNMLQLHPDILGFRLPKDPTRNHHPSIERGSDDRSSIDLSLFTFANFMQW